MSAITTAAGAMSTAAFGIGAADALGAAFLSLVDIGGRATEYGQNNRNNNEIDHSLFLSGKLCL